MWGQVVTRESRAQGGFERSRVEKVKETLVVKVVCEEYLTFVNDEMV